MTATSWKILLIIALIPAVFIIIYHYYYVYKVITAKCRICGGEAMGNWWRKIVSLYTPWKKIRSICEICQERERLDQKKKKKSKSKRLS